MPEDEHYYIQSSISYSRTNSRFWSFSKKEQFKDGVQMHNWNKGGNIEIKLNKIGSCNGWYYVKMNGSESYLDYDIQNTNQAESKIKFCKQKKIRKQAFLFKHLGNGRYKIYTLNGKVVSLKDKSSKNGSFLLVNEDKSGFFNEWFLLDKNRKPIKPEGVEMATFNIN